MKRTIHITVNHKSHALTVEPHATLLEVIREKLGLTGTKAGCHVGDCGSCTVILDGEPVNSCLVLAVQADGKDVVTIEGLETIQGPHPLQQAFAEAMRKEYQFSEASPELAANVRFVPRVH